MNNGESKKIQQEMAEIRHELNSSVEDAFVHAKEMTDWRNFVRSYPWACVALAAGIGYFAVPRRLHVLTPDPSTLAKLAEQNRLIVRPKPEPTGKPSVVGSAFNFLAGAAARSAMNLAGQYASQLLSNNNQSDVEASPRRAVHPR